MGRYLLHQDWQCSTSVCGTAQCSSPAYLLLDPTPDMPPSFCTWPRAQQVSTQQLEFAQKQATAAQEEAEALQKHVSRLEAELEGRSKQVRTPVRAPPFLFAVLHLRSRMPEGKGL